MIRLLEGEILGVTDIVTVGYEDPPDTSFLCDPLNEGSIEVGGVDHYVTIWVND